MASPTEEKKVTNWGGICVNANEIETKWANELINERKLFGIKLKLVFFCWIILESLPIKIRKTSYIFSSFSTDQFGSLLCASFRKKKKYEEQFNYLGTENFAKQQHF